MSHSTLDRLRYHFTDDLTSGVDATVPDHSVNYGNAFGLRSVPKWGETDRVTSISTNGTRSTSGSSAPFLPARSKQSTHSETGQQSVMTIRDFYQRTGVASKGGDDHPVGSRHVGPTTRFYVDDDNQLLTRTRVWS